MKSSKLVGLALVAGIVVMGLLGLVRAAQGFQWGRGLELITTIFTLVLCFSYFAFPKERKTWWYRILMVWAAMLLLSYLASFFMPATQSYSHVEERGEISGFILFWSMFTLLVLIFIKEFHRPGTVLKLNKNPLLTSLGSIAIIGGFLSGLVPFYYFYFTQIQIPPGGWGPLGLCEAGIFGMTIGFLVLLKPSKWLSILTAIITGMLLITLTSPHFTDLMVFLPLFLAAVILLFKSMKGEKMGKNTRRILWALFWVSFIVFPTMLLNEAGLGDFPVLLWWIIAVFIAIVYVKRVRKKRGTTENE